jgi:hypothetical protein
VLHPVAEEGEAFLVLADPGQHEAELRAHQPAAELVERDEDPEREVVVPGAFVSELRLRGISTLEAANAFLPAFSPISTLASPAPPPTPTRCGAPCRAIWRPC